MSGDESDLIDLAMSIVDGEEVDWGGVYRRAATDEQRLLIAQLETLARIKTAATTDAESMEARRLQRGLAPNWGPLRLLEELGSGGFGVVYRAWDTRLEREVALKLYRNDRPAPRAETAFLEGRLLARVRHPHVVSVYGIDIVDGQVGLWMELIRGKTLAELLEQQGPFGPREASLIGVDLCRALAAVHEAGLWHGDIKAQNVMREEGGRLVLMDFGLGRPLGDQHASGTVAGTPTYMGPEVLATGLGTNSADIYSLGVLLYHLVTGAFPVPGRSVLLRDARADLPEAFVQVVQRALSPTPAARFATAGAMEAALTAWLGLRAPSAALETADDALVLPIAPADRIEYLEHAATDIERLCRDDGNEDDLLKRLSDFVAEGTLLCEQLAAATFSRAEQPDHHGLVLSLCHLVEIVEKWTALARVRYSILEGYATHLENALKRPCHRLLERLEAQQSSVSAAGFLLFEGPAAAAPSSVDRLWQDLVSPDELRRHDAVVAIAGSSRDALLQELRSRTPAEREEGLEALWQTADLLMLVARAGAAPVFETAVELAVQPRARERWNCLYGFFASGAEQDAAQARALLEAYPEADRRVFARAFLLHPAEALRALALEILQPADFWLIVNDEGTPIGRLLEIWAHVLPRVTPGFLKVFFVCVRDKLIRPGGPERILAVVELVKEFYKVNAFHEDTFFQMLMELHERVRAEGRRHGLLVDVDADYVATLRVFMAEGTTRDLPVEGWSAVPLPIQRRVARLGYFLRHFVCHPLDPIALECLRHLQVLESVTEYVGIASINARLLSELAKEKQLFLKEDARYALAANPKTRAPVVLHHVRLLTRASLRRLGDNRQGNPLARRVALQILGRRYDASLPSIAP